MGGPDLEESKDIEHTNAMKISDLLNDNDSGESGTISSDTVPDSMGPPPRPIVPASVEPSVTPDNSEADRTG